jgi:hypothetical protein
VSDGAVLLLGLSAPNIERIVHFSFRNTWCEKTQYRSCGPIAAFILAAVGIRRDNHQYCRDDETAADDGISHIHDRTPAKSSQLQSNLNLLLIPTPSQPRSPSVSTSNQSHDQQQMQGANGGIDDPGADQ